MAHIEISHTDDGQNVRLQITDPILPGINADVPAADIGELVTIILGSCVDCARTTGEFSELKLKETDQKKLMYVSAHGVAISSGTDAADAAVAVLVFAIGATEWSIGIEKDVLAELGSKLQMISEDPKEPSQQKK